MEDDEDYNDAEFVRGIISGMSAFDFTAFAAELADAFKPSVITPLATHREYMQLHQALLNGDEDVNVTLDIPIYDMTGLEYSVYQCDHKMASIFFAAGANPNNNVFDGHMQTHASYHGVGEPITLPGFRHLEDNQAIPGFAGLRAILEGDDDQEDNNGEGTQKMLAFLWLMEICITNDKPLDLRRDFGQILSRLYQVHPEKDFGTRLVQIVRESLIACAAKGLPSEPSLKIAKIVTISSIWSFFTEEIVAECVQVDREDRRH